MSISVGSIVTPTTTVPEAEEHVAVFPSNPTQLVSVITDFSQGRGFGSKYAYSADNGTTWQENFVPTRNGALVTSDGLTWTQNSDPALAVDSTGQVFLVGVYKGSMGGGAANGIYVSNGMIGSGGLDFTAANTRPVFTHLQSNTGSHVDKPWIAVDATTSAYNGNVYVAFTDITRNLTTSTVQILFCRSTDHGQTWSAPITICTAKTVNTQFGGVQLAVGPDGQVYLIFGVVNIIEPDNVGRLFLTKSTDGGLTFGLPHQITPSGYTIDSATTAYDVRSLPSMAVTPSGTIEIVFPRYLPATQTYQAGIIQSTDQGATFSTYKALNDARAAFAFFTSVAVDASTGIIWVSWFDTRNDPTNPTYYDIYAVDSRDGGNTFSANVRITPQSDHAVLIGSTAFVGDYAGIAAGGGTAHPVWTSGGAGLQGGNGQLQTATLTDSATAGVAAHDLVTGAQVAGPVVPLPSGGDGPRAYPFGNASPDSGGAFAGGVSEGGAIRAPDQRPLPGAGRQVVPSGLFSIGQLDSWLAIDPGMATNGQDATGYNRA
jgi:hypothetical protein